MDTFVSLVAQQLGGALLFFPIVWLVMRKNQGKKLNVESVWLIAGFFSTAFVAAIIRFMAIFIIGGEAVMRPMGGLQVFFFLILPILIAIGICAFLRTKATSHTTSKNT